jgi:hypothetical protein
MTKKKAKGKTEAKKTAKNKTAAKKTKVRNPAGVRNDIAKIVEAGARKIAKAVMEQAMSGQLAPAKYLFEIAEIYPLSTDGSHATENEDCLARTLLNRLDIPDEPIGRDEEDAPKAVTLVVKVAVKPAEKTEGEAERKNSGSGPETDNDKQGSVLV